MEKENKFKEELAFLVESFGEGSQDGIKEALRFTQDLFGYVSRVNQRHIAEGFQVEEKLVRTLIKFNPSIKELVSKYEVTCCTGDRCRKRGSLEVIKTIRSELGIGFDEITEDGRVRLSSQNCFKECSRGPNIKVNGRFYHNMTKEKAVDLIKSLK